MCVCVCVCVFKCVFKCVFVFFSSQIVDVVNGSDMIESYKLCSHSTGEGVDEVFQEAIRVALGATLSKEATLRQWCRIIGMPERVSAKARGPGKLLIDFFIERPVPGQGQGLG